MSWPYSTHPLKHYAAKLRGVPDAQRELLDIRTSPPVVRSWREPEEHTSGSGARRPTPPPSTPTGVDMSMEIEGGEKIDHGRGASASNMRTSHLEHWQRAIARLEKSVLRRWRWAVPREPLEPR